MESFADFMQVVLAPLVGTGILVSLTGIWKHVKQTREDIERGAKLQDAVDKLEGTTNTLQTATQDLSTQVGKVAGQVTDVREQLTLNGTSLPTVWAEHQRSHDQLASEVIARWDDHHRERGRTRSQLTDALTRLERIERKVGTLMSRPRRWWSNWR